MFIIKTIIIFILPGLVSWLCVKRIAKSKFAFFENLFFILFISFLLSSLISIVLLTFNAFSINYLISVNLIYCLICLAIFKPKIFTDKFVAYKINVRAIVLLIILITASIFFFQPSYYIIQNYDGSIYLNTGINISKIGSININDTLVNSIPKNVQDEIFENLKVNNRSIPEIKARFLGGITVSENNKINPMFLPLYPLWISIFNSLFGLKSVFFINSFFAVLSVLAICLIGQNLFNNIDVGLIAASLLTINYVQNFFARFPISEMITQLILLGGLLMLIYYYNEQSLYFALISCFSLGVVLFAKFEFFIFILLFILIIFLEETFSNKSTKYFGTFIIAFVIIFSFSLYNLGNLSHDYALMLYKSLPSGKIILGCSILIFIVILLMIIKNKIKEYFYLYKNIIIFIAILSVVVLSLYSYFIRPHSSFLIDSDTVTRRGVTLNYFNKFNFVNFANIISPLGLCFSIIGLILIMRKEINKKTIAFLILTMPSCFLFFYKINTWPEFPWLLRRYVILVLPTSILLLSFFLNEIKKYLGFSFRDKRALHRNLNHGSDNKSLKISTNLNLSFFTKCIEYLKRKFKILIYIKERKIKINSLQFAVIVIILLYLFTFFIAKSSPIIKSKFLTNAKIQLEKIANTIDNDYLIITDQSLRGTHIAPTLAYTYGKNVIEIHDDANVCAHSINFTNFLKNWLNSGKRIFFLKHIGTTKFSPGVFIYKLVNEFSFEYETLQTQPNKLYTPNIISDRFKLQLYEILLAANSKNPKFALDIGLNDYGYIEKGFSETFYDVTAKQSYGAVSNLANLIFPKIDLNIPYELIIKASINYKQEQTENSSEDFIQIFADNVLICKETLYTEPHIYRCILPSDKVYNSQKLDISDYLQNNNYLQTSKDQFELNKKLRKALLIKIKLLTSEISVNNKYIKLYWVKFQPKIERNEESEIFIDVGTENDWEYINNFYYPELAPDGKTFRWSTDNSYIKVPLSTKYDYSFEILSDLGPLKELNQVAVFVNSYEIISNLRNGYSKQIISKDLTTRNYSYIHFIGKLWSPAIVLGTDDGRNLGVVIFWIRFRPILK